MRNTEASQRPTVGILYPGEMGSALAQVVMGDGFRVVTTLEGRSARTRRRCVEACLNVLDSFWDVVRASEVVFSLVPPGAALALAGQSRPAAEGLSQPPLSVDANSISP